MVLQIGERMRHQFGGPWTVEKLDALSAYLTAYAQALKKTSFRRLYIDAFAGTGDRSGTRQRTASLLEIPELDEMTKGSVRVALEIDPPFDRYVFIEKRQRRSSALEHLRSEFADRAIEILNEDANTAVQRICRETNCPICGNADPTTQKAARAWPFQASTPPWIAQAEMGHPRYQRGQFHGSRAALDAR